MLARVSQTNFLSPWVGPLGLGAEGWGTKFRAFFFFLSRHSFHSFLPLLLVLSWNLGGVFEAPGQTCTFKGPGLQKHHQNSTKGPTREREKNENCGGRGKKRNFGGPAEGGPAEEETDCGQSRFGHPHLTNFGQSNLGQSIFGQSQQSIIGQYDGRKGGDKSQKKIGRRVGPRKVEPRRVGPRRVGAQNFALFVPSPAPFFQPRRLRGRRGFTRQPENSKREHLTAQALPNTTKKPREDPQRETKRAKMVTGERKKERNFGRYSGGVSSGGVSGGGVVQTNNTPPTRTTNTTTNNKQHTTNNTQQQNTTPHHTTPHHTTRTAKQTTTHNNTTQHKTTQQHSTAQQHHTNRKTNNNTQQHNKQVENRTTLPPTPTTTHPTPTTTQRNTQKWIGQKWIGQKWPNH